MIKEIPTEKHTYVHTRKQENMSSTEASKPLFRLFKNSRKKYETVKYETLNDGKKRVPTFDCSRFHSDQFAKFSLPKIRTLIKQMGWSKRDLCDELEQELITANHSKLDQAFRKSGIDPDDGNDDDLEEQFDTLMVYFLDEIDGRNNAGNIVLNSCKPPALSFDDVLKKYGDQMDCKPSDVLGRVLTTRELALKTLAIADGTEPSDETNKRDYFFIFNEQARYWFKNEYREGGPYDYYSMDKIAAGMDVYFKKKIDAIKEANRNQGKKRKYDDEDETKDNDNTGFSNSHPENKDSNCDTSSESQEDGDNYKSSHLPDDEEVADNDSDTSDESREDSGDYNSNHSDDEEVASNDSDTSDKCQVQSKQGRKGDDGDCNPRRYINQHYGHGSYNKYRSNKKRRRDNNNYQREGSNVFRDGNGPKDRCNLAFCNRNGNPANHSNEDCKWQRQSRSGPTWWTGNEQSRSNHGNRGGSRSGSASRPHHRSSFW